ncbi:hypothetical protein GCM10027589_56570 [Actinocorallia lasiicapitis]
MIELVQPQRIAEWFRPERPGPVIGPHVLRTGHGRVFADHAEQPRAVLVETGGENFDLSGDPAAFTPERALRGIFRADQEFEPLLGAYGAEVHRWPRVIYELQAASRDLSPVEAEIRRLGPADAPALDALPAEIHWITETWGGPAGAAKGGLAFGAFAEGALVSVAIPFYTGEKYEDIGVVTEESHRARGLSAACATAVIKDVLARGHRPTWSTSPDNIASRRVAAKLGFRFVRADLLYLVGRGL